MGHQGRRLLRLSPGSGLREHQRDDRDDRNRNRACDGEA